MGKVVYKKEGSLKEREIYVKECHFPLSEKGWGNYYAHTFILYRPKRCRDWRLEAGCVQEGWAIHRHYGYHFHDRIKLSSIDVDIKDTDSPEKMFDRLTKIARRKGMKICWG